MFLSKPHILALMVLLSTSMTASAIQQLEVVALFSGKAVVMLDGERRVLAEGETAEGIRLISADSSRAIFLINGERKTYTLGSSVNMNFAAPTVVRKQLFADEAGMFRTVGSINGYPVNILVDTGASVVAMNANEAQRLGIPFRMEGEPTRVSTASGMANAYRIVLDSVKIGKIEQNNVAATVVDGPHPQWVLLGMSFLERLKVSKEGGRMILEQRQ